MKSLFLLLNNLAEIEVGQIWRGKNDINFEIEILEISYCTNREYDYAYIEYNRSGNRTWLFSTVIQTFYELI